MSKEAPNDSITASEALVRAIAFRIGMHENPELIELICDNMKNEYIVEEWQLSALDSFQWQSLGAPIGLAASFRALSNIPDPTQSKTAADELPSMIRSGSIKPQLSLSSLNNRTSVIEQLARGLHTSLFARDATTNDRLHSINRSSFAPEIQSASQETATEKVSLDVQQNDAPIIETVDEESPDILAPGNNSPSAIPIPTDRLPTSNLNNGNASTINYQPPNSVRTVRGNLQRYRRDKLFQGRSFPMSDTFYKALNRCKSGAELKSQMVFVMELNVVASALLLGAAVELWGVFPADAVMNTSQGKSTDEPYVPFSLAMMYHFFSCISLITQLTCTSGWIWSLRATSAVSANKFQEFLVQTRFAFSVFDKFSMVGQMVFVINISLLLGAMVAATTTNSTLRRMGFFAPVVLLLMGNRFVHNVSSYIGRVAYHGFLLTDVEIDPDDYNTSSSGPTSAFQNEQQQHQPYDHSNLSAPQYTSTIDQQLDKKFQSHNVLSEDRALEIYNAIALNTKTTIPLGGDNDKGTPGLLDYMFSTSTMRSSTHTAVVPPSIMAQKDDSSSKKNSLDHLEKDTTTTAVSVANDEKS